MRPINSILKKFESNYSVLNFDYKGLENSCSYCNIQWLLSKSELDVKSWEQLNPIWLSIVNSLYSPCLLTSMYVILLTDGSALSAKCDDDDD